MRDPGLTHKATMESETRAAARGGVTTVLDMPNVVPQTTTLQLLKERYAMAEGKCHVNYGFYLGATNDNLEEIKRLDPTRCPGVKLFMGSSTGNMLVDREEVLHRIFRDSPTLIVAHCEDTARIKSEERRVKSEERRVKNESNIQGSEGNSDSSLFTLHSSLQTPDSSLFTLHSSLPIAFASRWPRESPGIMRQTYSTAIDNAQHLVQIVNPYAGLFGEVRAALRRALERGVRVQFMVSTKSDGKANDDVTGLEMRKLMKRGAEVYLYDGGFHHSKVMMIDSIFCTVGTTNLDARSLCFDYEVNAFIFSPTTTHELQQIFRDDIEHSTLLTPEVWKERFPASRRFRARIFTIAKRLM